MNWKLIKKEKPRPGMPVRLLFRDNRTANGLVDDAGNILTLDGEIIAWKPRKPGTI